MLLKRNTDAKLAKFYQGKEMTVSKNVNDVTKFSAIVVNVIDAIQPIEGMKLPICQFQ